MNRAALTHRHSTENKFKSGQDGFSMAVYGQRSFLILFSFDFFRIFQTYHNKYIFLTHA